MCNNTKIVFLLFPYQSNDLPMNLRVLIRVSMSRAQDLRRNLCLVPCWPQVGKLYFDKWVLQPWDSEVEARNPWVGTHSCNTVRSLQYRSLCCKRDSTASQNLWIVDSHEQYGICTVWRTYLAFRVLISKAREPHQFFKSFWVTTPSTVSNHRNIRLQIKYSHFKYLT